MPYRRKNQKRIKCDKWTLTIALELYSIDKALLKKEVRLPSDDFRRHSQEKVAKNRNLLEYLTCEIVSFKTSWQKLWLYSIKQKSVYGRTDSFNKYSRVIG